MSWLSHFKNEVINALMHATPADQQAPVHLAAMNAASSIDALGQTLATAATTVVETAITAHLGPVAGALSYDFILALEAAVASKKATLQVPTAPPAAPPAPVA